MPSLFLPSDDYLYWKQNQIDPKSSRMINLPGEVELYGNAEKLKKIAVKVSAISFGGLNTNSDAFMSVARLESLFKRHWRDLCAPEKQTSAEKESDTDTRPEWCEHNTEYWRAFIENKMYPCEGTELGCYKIFHSANQKRSAVVFYFPDQVPKRVRLWDVVQLPKVITKAYRKNESNTLKSAQNYFLSRAALPAQELCHENCVQGNLIRIELIEGFLSEIDMRPDDKDKKSEKIEKAIKAILDPLKKERPLSKEKLNRAILLVNRLPGIKASIYFLPAKKIFTQKDKNRPVSLAQRGAAKVYVRYKAQPAKMGIGYANHGSDVVGPFFQHIRFESNNLLKAGTQLAITHLKASQQKTMQYLAGELGIPLSNDGLRLRLKGTHSRSHPSGNMSVFGLRGDTQQYEVALEYPLYLQPNSQWIMDAGITYRDSRTKIFTNKPYLYDRIRKAHLEFSYRNGKGERPPIKDGELQRLGRDVSEFSFRYDHGLRFQSATEPDDNYASRPEAQPTFEKLSSKIRWYKEFGVHERHGQNNQLGYLERCVPPFYSDDLKKRNWWDDCFYIDPFRRWFYDVKVAGQITNKEPLPVSEEMSLGGQNFAEPFQFGAKSGDWGIAGRLETGFVLKKTWDSNKYFEDGIQVERVYRHQYDFIPYAFIEGGHLKNRDTTSKQWGNYDSHLGAWGGGFRFVIQPDMALNFDTFKNPFFPDLRQFKVDLSVADPLNKNNNEADIRTDIKFGSLVLSGNITAQWAW
ncbi:ShlB/FhaC/HecB family hemolysin secretion/activation protein [Magnetococcales bacterium HHB-1]